MGRRRIGNRCGVYRRVIVAANGFRNDPHLKKISRSYVSDFISKFP